MTMSTPAFFGEVPAIAVRDPLADLLGAAEDGRIEYQYIDAVKLAGLAAPVEALVHDIEARAHGSARARLIDYLLRAGAAREGEVEVRLPTTKVALASQLGLTAEHLSRVLHDLAQRNLIRADRRRIVIGDVATLAGHARGSRGTRRKVVE